MDGVLSSLFASSVPICRLLLLSRYQEQKVRDSYVCIRKAVEPKSEPKQVISFTINANCVITLAWDVIV